MHVAGAASGLDRLLQHFGVVAARSELLFVFLVSLGGLSLAATLEYCLVKLGFSEINREELVRHGLAFVFFLTLVFGPLVETLLLQQVPILLARRFHFPTALQLAAGSVPFAVLHFDAGAGGIAAGIAGGLAYSLAYLTFLEKSKAKAYWLTAASHALYNVLPSAIIVKDLA